MYSWLIDTYLFLLLVLLVLVVLGALLGLLLDGGDVVAEVREERHLLLEGVHVQLALRGSLKRYKD